MKFVIDDRIPYIRGVLEPFGEVVYLRGSDISSDDVKDANAIITRTRTICNEKLLAGSSVRFIATATIGYDHIDTDYCDDAGIAWANAPGCNSGSVEQYVASALATLSRKKGFRLEGKTIGVIGAGHVGTKVADLCRLLGMNVLLNDPPRARTEGNVKFCDLDVIQRESDMITLHVPLYMKGMDKTYHMIDADFFSSLDRKPILINSCRGEVLDSMAVKSALDFCQISGLVIDCWENEPYIDPELLDRADLATPHIAGYSRDGKANGTRMSVRSLSNFFGLGIDDWDVSEIETPEQPDILLDGSGKTSEELILQAILYTYDIQKDDASLRSQPGQFEKLRGMYPVRREFQAFDVITKDVDSGTIDTLKMLGFKVKG